VLSHSRVRIDDLPSSTRNEHCDNAEHTIGTNDAKKIIAARPPSLFVTRRNDF
jgi:hypothetical protein